MHPLRCWQVDLGKMTEYLTGAGRDSSFIPAIIVVKRSSCVLSMWIEIVSIMFKNELKVIDVRRPLAALNKSFSSRSRTV